MSNSTSKKGKVSSASAVRAFSHSAPTALNNPKRSSPGDELARLRDEVANLRVKNDRLRDTNDRLRATNDRLENENASLFSQCKEGDAAYAKLQDELDRKMDISEFRGRQRDKLVKENISQEYDISQLRIENNHLKFKVELGLRGVEDRFKMGEDAVQSSNYWWDRLLAERRARVNALQSIPTPLVPSDAKELLDLQNKIKHMLYSKSMLRQSFRSHVYVPTNKE